MKSAQFNPIMTSLRD